ncbi:hypothetical protein T10_870 [Trichinella papuae]|uniref:Uncharacterized protein n=1 Tax=Trichinella papuae TaxID=268474 RepID=A0A0V1N064_9BILA|nr:hypothetical protein T10_870 [Trichinella papuae]
MAHFSYTSNQMVNSNFGNVPANRNHQSNQVGNPMVNSGDARMNGRFKFITAHQMQNKNSMPTSSNYYKTNACGANTYTSNQMVNTNIGNVPANEIYCQGVNRGDAVMSTKSNILQPSEIQETNLMEPSCYWNSNEAACGKTYATYKMGNATDSDVVVNENYGLHMNLNDNYAANVCGAMNSSNELSSAIESYSAVNSNAPLQSYENCETFSRVPYQALSSNDGWIAETGALSNVVPNDVSLIGNDANCNVNQDATQNANEFAYLNHDCFVNDDTSQIQFQNAVSPNVGFASAEIEYGQSISFEYATGQVVGDSHAVNATMYQANCFVNTGDFLQNGNDCVQYGDGTLSYDAIIFWEDEQIESQSVVIISNNVDEFDEFLDDIIFGSHYADVLSMEFVDWLQTRNALINVHKLHLSCYPVIADYKSCDELLMNFE